MRWIRRKIWGTQEKSKTVLYEVKLLQKYKSNISRHKFHNRILELEIFFIDLSRVPVRTTNRVVSQKSNLPISNRY